MPSYILYTNQYQRSSHNQGNKWNLKAKMKLKFAYRTLFYIYVSHSITSSVSFLSSTHFFSWSPGAPIYTKDIRIKVTQVGIT